MVFLEDSFFSRRSLRPSSALSLEDSPPENRRFKKGKVKNVAVVFISKLDGERTINEGLCLKCAKELGLPQVDDMMKRMGISDEDLETLNSEKTAAAPPPPGRSFHLQRR